MVTLFNRAGNGPIVDSVSEAELRVFHLALLATGFFLNLVHSHLALQPLLPGSVAFKTHYTELLISFISAQIII
jgi:hypothetical protein